MAITSLNLVIDIENGTFLQAVGSRINANTIRLAQGDNIAVTATMVTQSDDFTTPTPITNFPAGCTVTVGVGIPGEPVCALALLNGPDSLEGPIRTGTLNLNTPEIDTLLGPETSVPAYIEVELIETDGTITTLAQVQCVVINDLLIGGTPPEPAEPPYPSSPALIAQLQHLEDDKADKTTTITGTGKLTGGGDLSANRTLDMAPAPQATITGRASGAGTGTPTDLTGTQVAAILPDASATVRGVVPVGMIPVAGAFPTDTQLMAGASPQAGRPGGVYRAAGSTMTGTLPAQSGDYCALAEIHALPASLTEILVGSGSGATVTIYASKTQVKIDCAAGGNATSMTLASVDKAHFAVNRTGLRAFELFRDGESVLTLTASADTSTSLPMPTAANTYAHAAKDFKWTNRALTDAEIKACDKGEIPAELASLGYAINNTAFSGGTSSGFTGDSVVSTSFGKNHLLSQKFRFRFTSTGTGEIKLSDASLALEVSAPVAYVVGANDVTLTGYTGTPGGIYFYPAASQTVSGFTAQAIGTVAHFPADQVVHSGAWCGKFGAVLRPGSGITPLDPVPSVSYVISGTVAGATVTAGAVASIGTFTPTAGLSATALASAAQWDSVSAGWAQARPANAGDIAAAITTAGTLFLECAAHTSNATVSAGTAVKAVLTIN